MIRRFAFLFLLVVTASLIPGKRVRADAGPVTAPLAIGAMTSTLEAPPQLQAALLVRRSHNPMRSVALAIGWLLVVAVIGTVVMAFGADKLQIVVATMQDGIGKSLGTGILGHLAIVPGAVGVVVLLAATLIGILLIPLGLVAFMLAVAGIAMFGFIAVTIMTGLAISAGKKRDETAQGAMLRAFFTGTAVYLGMWVLVAAFSGVPLLGAMLASFASAVTFIAVTTGFGAVLLSWWRGAFKRTPVVPA